MGRKKTRQRKTWKKRRMRGGMFGSHTLGSAWNYAVSHFKTTPEQKTINQFDSEIKYLKNIFSESFIETIETLKPQICEKYNKEPTSLEEETNYLNWTIIN